MLEQVPYCDVSLATIEVLDVADFSFAIENFNHSVLKAEFFSIDKLQDRDRRNGF